MFTIGSLNADALSIDFRPTYRRRGDAFSIFLADTNVQLGNNTNNTTITLATITLAVSNEVQVGNKKVAVSNDCYSPLGASAHFGACADHRGGGYMHSRQ